MDRCCRRGYFVRSRLRAGAALAAVGAGLLPGHAHGQLSSEFTPAEITDIRNSIGDRIEALTILGGDFGLAGGTFRSTGKFEFGEDTNSSLSVSKFGGAGEIGDPQPLGSLGIGWQPRVQGNMGWTQNSQTLSTGVLQGDVSTFNGYGIEFGGGPRLWLSDRFSLAPTLMGLYGHQSESYTANSAFMRANLPEAEHLGLVNFSVDTWSVVAAVSAEYVFTWNRTIITLSSTPTYFHTQSFNASSQYIDIKGNSGFWANKIDVDMPIGRYLFGHEIRVGGYFNRSDLYGGLKSGLNDNYINEAHGRVVLDFLNQFWKVQWIGFGVSYLWGSNITGWTGGLDVTFRF